MAKAKITIQPTMLAEKEAAELDPELKLKGDQVAELIKQGHHHATNAVESVRKSCEYYWQAGGIVIEIKQIQKKGRKRPIGFGEVCNSCGFSDEWATQCQRLRELYPSLEDIPPVKNITQLKRLSGILKHRATKVKKPVVKKSADDEGIETVKSLVTDLALFTQQLADNLPAEMPDDLLGIIFDTSLTLADIGVAMVESQANAKGAEIQRLKQEKGT